MTKEELAKKKGFKIKETTQTAAEALITTKTEVNEEVKTEPKKTEEKPKTKAVAPKKTTTKKSTPKKTKEPPKAGRPKGKPSTKISLNVPDEYLEIVNIAAGINYKGNTSSYIVSLIEKDIKANGKVYQQIKAITEA